MSSTKEMLYWARTAPWKEAKLPHLCTTCNKNELQNGFPFSAHDNRNLIQGAGEYLDTGLGRKKTPLDKKQHSSGHFNVFCHDQPPRPTSYWDGFTDHQISYRGSQDTEKPLCRRYPKHHHERSTHMRDLPENRFMWFGDYRSV
ncbi:testis-expressed protein 36 isoform X2 [Engystomops pustulosus]